MSHSPYVNNKLLKQHLRSAGLRDSNIPLLVADGCADTSHLGYVALQESCRY